MVVFTSKQDLTAYLTKLKAKNSQIGFVPTMGALHHGHTSLLERAKKENDIVCCSVFINPTQFNKKEDFDNYPVTTKEDLLTLKKVKCDVAFFPSYHEVYEKDAIMKKYDFGLLDKVMEAKHRPGHFNGMANVVQRLFAIVKPHIAYFGLKDYQQFLIIKELVKQEKHEIEIIGCPIKREANGLAMSSRNKRISEEGKEHAAFIYHVLNQCINSYKTKSTEEITKQVKQTFNEHINLKLEYFSIVNANTLNQVKDKQNEPAVACIAVWCEEVRLIDNLIING